METKRFVAAGDAPVRADVAVSEALSVTRTAAAKLIEAGNAECRNKILKKNTLIEPGAEVTVTVPDVRPLEVKAQSIPLKIVYEDDDLLVVDKPKGMVVHPAPGNPDGTLVNALLAHCGDSLSGINGVARPGILHRIDKNTSGLLMVAKNDKAHSSLAEQIKEHSFVREYEAVVYGEMKTDSGDVDAPIGRHPVKRKQMAVTPLNSKPARTHYEVIDRAGGFTHLRLRLYTGRTHQIRVHMAYIGHPLAGDDVYGPKKVITSLQGQCLHAKKLGFIHPSTGEYMEFDSELPDVFRSFMDSVGLK